MIFDDLLGIFREKTVHSREDSSDQIMCVDTPRACELQRNKVIDKINARHKLASIEKLEKLTNIITSDSGIETNSKSKEIIQVKSVNKENIVKDDNESELKELKIKCELAFDTIKRQETRIQELLESEKELQEKFKLLTLQLEHEKIENIKQRDHEKEMLKQSEVSFKDCLATLVAEQKDQIQTLIKSQGELLTQVINNTNSKDSPKIVVSDKSAFERVIECAPPRCGKKENVSFFLRTKFENHIALRFTERDEQVIALSLIFGDNFTRAKCIRELADKLLPENPRVEADRLATYRAINKKYNKCKTIKIDSLGSEEDFESLFTRIKIKHEEEAFDKGFSIPNSVLNRISLQDMADCDKNFMSASYRNLVRSIAISELGGKWKNSEISDLKINDFLEVMFHEKDRADTVVLRDAPNLGAGHEDVVENECLKSENFDCANYCDQNTQCDRERNSETIAIIVSEEHPFGIPDPQGCLKCNRRGHRAFECPYFWSCKSCLQETENGVFINNPHSIPRYTECDRHPIAFKSLSTLLQSISAK